MPTPLQPLLDAIAALPAAAQDAQKLRTRALAATCAQCHGTDDDRLAQLQGQLRCGTQCGSCLPALRRLVSEVPEGVTS